MPRRERGNYERIELPNGMWMLVYETGVVKIAKYNARMRVTEVLNRKGGAHVFVEVTPDAPTG